MRNIKPASIFILITISFLINSCHKDAELPVQPTKTGTLMISMENDMNGKKIYFDTVKYLNAHGDTFKISTLKYYVSNIRLKDTLGNYFNVPDSYYLIDVRANNDTTLTIPNIPIGNYTQLELAVGIDSVHNHTGAQKGALDPTVASTMFWTWSSGYKFVVLEGTYKTSTSNGYKPLVLHIADDINFKHFAFNSGIANWESINIRENRNSIVNVNLNFDEMFKTPVIIDFDVTNNVSGGSESTIIANNYSDMIHLSGIINK